MPEIVVHHRVDTEARKRSSDYRLRKRQSFRAGWYLYFLFFPFKLIPRKLAYTLWTQIQLKVFRGDWNAGLGVLQAIGDVVINMHRIIKDYNRLSIEELMEFSK